MASIGGCWSMRRQTFLDIGGYDPGMKGWGAEDFELALRVWMCLDHGSVEILPCSQVGHIYRAGKAPYKPTNITGLNFQRTAELWLGEYRHLFYTVWPFLRENDPGDLSYLREMKQKLKCRDFKWFLSNIATHKHVPDLDDAYIGQFQLAGESQCWDTYGDKQGDPICMYPCTADSGNQIYIVSEGQIFWQVDNCIVISGDDSTTAVKRACASNLSPEWSYNKDSGSFVHLPTGRCLDAGSQPSISTRTCLQLKECSDAATQQWTFIKFKL